jgi:hypothetical protein
MLTPGLDIGPLVSELEARVAEELDYELEAAWQAAFAEAYEGDPDVVIPRPVAGSRHVLVSEWIEGTPFSKIIKDGSTEDRDRAGILLVRFLYSGPGRAGLLHADPHPGNFRLLADGRLGVLDFGAVNRLPAGLPEPIGRLTRFALAGKAAAVADGLRSEGFIPPSAKIDTELLLDFLAPLLEPVAGEQFTFSRSWLRSQATRLGGQRRRDHDSAEAAGEGVGAGPEARGSGSRNDRRPPAAQIGRQLNLPPSYLLIHRVSLGAVSVLCQLGSTGPFRAEMERWQPGFAEPGSSAAEHAAEANRPGRHLPDLAVEEHDGVIRACPSLLFADTADTAGTAGTAGSPEASGRALWPRGAPHRRAMPITGTPQATGTPPTRGTPPKTGTSGSTGTLRVHRRAPN